MVNYSNAKVYMIESASTGLIYYGSTCSPLYKRMYEHRNSYKACLKNPERYLTSSFKVLENKDARILLVKVCPCANKQSLHAIEAKYIRENDCVNKCVPGRTRQQYREDVKDKTRIHRSVRILCECGTTVCRGRLPLHKKTAKHARLLAALK